MAPRCRGSRVQRAVGACGRGAARGSCGPARLRPASARRVAGDDGRPALRSGLGLRRVGSPGGPALPGPVAAEPERGGRRGAAADAADRDHEERPGAVGGAAGGPVVAAVRRDRLCDAGHGREQARRRPGAAAGERLGAGGERGDDGRPRCGCPAIRAGAGQRPARALGSPGAPPPALRRDGLARGRGDHARRAGGGVAVAARALGRRSVLQRFRRRGGGRRARHGAR